MTGRMVTKGAPIQLVVLTVQLVLCSYSFSFMRRTVFFALSAAVLYELSAAVLPSPYLVKVSVLHGERVLFLVLLVPAVLHPRNAGASVQRNHVGVHCRRHPQPHLCDRCADGSPALEQRSCSRLLFPPSSSLKAVSLLHRSPLLPRFSAALPSLSPSLLSRLLSSPLFSAWHSLRVQRQDRVQLRRGEVLECVVVRVLPTPSCSCCLGS